MLHVILKMQRKITRFTGLIFISILLIRKGIDKHEKQTDNRW